MAASLFFPGDQNFENLDEGLEFILERIESLRVALELY